MKHSGEDLCSDEKGRWKGQGLRYYAICQKAKMQADMYKQVAVFETPCKQLLKC